MAIEAVISEALDPKTADSPTLSRQLPEQADIATNPMPNDTGRFVPRIIHGETTPSAINKVAK